MFCSKQYIVAEKLKRKSRRSHILHFIILELQNIPLCLVINQLSIIYWIVVFSNLLSTLNVSVWGYTYFKNWITFLWYHPCKDCKNKVSLKNLRILSWKFAILSLHINEKFMKPSVNPYYNSLFVYLNIFIHSFCTNIKILYFYYRHAFKLCFLNHRKYPFLLVDYFEA